MSSREIYQIEIINLRKYQTRTDIKSMKYFRVNSRIFEDPQFYVLDQSSKLLWFFILSQAALENSASIRLNPSQVQANTGLNGRWIRSSIFKLEEFQWVKVVSRYGNGPKVKESKVKESKVKVKESKVKANRPERPSSQEPEQQEILKSEPWLVQQWNERVDKKLPAVKVINNARSKNLKRAMKEIPGKGQWLDIFEKINKSDFLLGNSESGWKCNFDWLIKPGNALKVLEGNYDNGTRRRRMTREEAVSQGNAELYWKIQNEGDENENREVNTCGLS